MFDILTGEGLFNLKKPKPSSIGLESMAKALTRVNRFGGHTRRPYSTASHSLLVASLCPPHLRLQALLHDAAEAYIGDIPTPVKKLLGQKEVEAVEEKIIEAVYAKIGLKQKQLTKEVMAADRHSLYVESLALFDVSCDPYSVFEKYKVEGMQVNFDFVQNQMYLTERELKEQYLSALNAEIAKHKRGDYDKHFKLKSRDNLRDTQEMVG